MIGGTDWFRRIAERVTPTSKDLQFTIMIFVVLLITLAATQEVLLIYLLLFLIGALMAHTPLFKNNGFPADLVVLWLSAAFPAAPQQPGATINGDMALSTLKVHPYHLSRGLQHARLNLFTGCHNKEKRLKGQESRSISLTSLWISFTIGNLYVDRSGRRKVSTSGNVD
jgi:hypothetical protein